MKHITLKLAVTVLAFFVGVTATALWPAPSTSPKICLYDSYIPIGTLSPWDSKYITEFYSAMLEQPFSCLDENTEAYRLLYVPAFETPASIRVWRDGGRKFIELRQLASIGMPQYGAKDMKKIVTRPLSEDEWDRFYRLLEKSNFWSAPTQGGRAGLDGVGILLEGKKEGKYHAVGRRLPEEQNFVDMCNYLLEISGREQEDHERAYTEAHSST